MRDAAIGRIERRLDAVVPAKIIRAAPQVEVAAVLTRASAPAPTTVLTASAPIIPAKGIGQARPYVPSQPAITPAVAPVEPTAGKVWPVTTSATIRTPAITTLRPATRLSASRPIAAADRLRVGFDANPAVVFDAVNYTQSAKPNLVPSVSPASQPTLSDARQVRSRVDLATRVPGTPVQPNSLAASPFDALALARSARIRKRRKGADTDDMRLVTLPTLNAVPVLGTLPSLDRLAAEAARLSLDADRLGDDDLVRVARLKAIDAYVADYSGEDGRVETDYPALKAIGSDGTGFRRQACSRRYAPCATSSSR